jgi:hypothetical protein
MSINKNLFAAVNELVTATLWKIIFFENSASLFYLLAHSVLMLLRESIGQAILVDLHEERKVKEAWYSPSNIASGL